MNSWGRLEKVILWSGLTINAFSQAIGLRRAENLYQIKKGNNSISKELAEKIVSKYPHISKSWLLTGEGNMFVDEKEDESSIKSIPFYNSGLLEFSLDADSKEHTPLYNIQIPSLSNCDFAATCVGNSMHPDIPSGSIVALKEVNFNNILFGEIYFIVTDSYSTIKYLRQVEGDDSKYRLVPKNTTEFDEVILDKSQIRRLFLVKGVISTKVL